MAHTGRKPAMASPQANTTPCCSAMPTSKVRSGNRACMCCSPVPFSIAAVIAMTRGSRSASVTNDRPNTSV